MTTTRRDRRLFNEYSLLEEYVGRKQHVKLESIAGDPPTLYEVSFATCGVVRLEDDHPVYSIEHRVKIELPAEYPRSGPILTWLTPIFHSNISPDGQVCVSTWVPGRTLAVLCQQLDDMIAYRNFDPHEGLSDKAMNPQAANWVLRHPECFPLTHENCL